jgi:hypothetical protein
MSLVGRNFEKRFPGYGAKLWQGKVVEDVGNGKYEVEYEDGSSALMSSKTIENLIEVEKEKGPATKGKGKAAAKGKGKAPAKAAKAKAPAASKRPGKAAAKKAAPAKASVGKAAASKRKSIGGSNTK